MTNEEARNIIEYGNLRIIWDMAYCSIYQGGSFLADLTFTELQAIMHFAPKQNEQPYLNP